MAERIRNIFLGASDGAPTTEPMASECEAHLVLACRSQHVAQVIEPALANGVIVLCDRFVDSTLAYQGYGRGLDLAVLRTLNRFATRGLRPSLTLLFDLPTRVGLARRRRQAAELNRLDRETRRFHELVRRGFLKLAVREPRRIKVVDATADADEIAHVVGRLIRPLLAKRDSR
jgi:dTMP kinase